MSRKKKWWIGIGIVLVLGLVAYGNLGLNRPTGIPVTVEKLEKRDLESIVSASGKVQPKRKVSISAETMGKVTDLKVQEGDLVTKGQLLLQIDSRNLETQVQNREASLASAKLQLDQTRAQIDNSKVAVKEAEDTKTRQEQMFKNGLLPRDQWERIVNDVARQKTNLLVAEQNARTQEQRIKQEEANLDSAQYDLNKLRVVSPIAGIVTRRNIEVGETAVVGTMNNAGTVLLEIADLSVIETEIEVDETDIPFIRIGQPAKVKIDAMPDQEFPGKVTEVGNSPIQAAGQTSGRATNFKVKVTIDGAVPNVRPGFTCTAIITTATRQKTLSVPIQAMTVREVIVDKAGNVVKRDAPTGPTASSAPRPVTPQEPKEGETRKEVEGTFIIKDGRAAFVPVKVGIAGEKYFEVLSGLKDGDEVITGPFASVRTLREGDQVRATTAPAGTPGATPGK